MDYGDAYSGMSNDEIMHVATDRSALRTDALPFLDAELKKRGLSEKDINEYRQHLAATAPGNLPGKEQFVARATNGFGTKIYGKRDFWQDGSYIATKWVILFWIPLVPLKSIRVKEVGPSHILPAWFTQDRGSTQYLVYSRQPLNLKQIAFIYSYLLLLIGGFSAIAILDGSLWFVPPLILSPVLVLPWFFRRHARERVKQRCDATTKQILQSQPSETYPAERVGVPRQKTSTEQEAAALFVVSILRETQHAWPTVYSNLKESREEKFVLEDESMAVFDLGLAAIAQDLQAVKNLFPSEQADRIEKWVLTWVLKCFDTHDWGDYAVDEVKKYGAEFQKESRIGAEFALGAIPGRLLHRWLCKGIKNLEGEIGGEKTGFIDTMLMAEVTNQVIGFSGIWKRFKDDFDLVEGDPKYTLTKTKIWENMDETDRIMMDQSLTDAERAAAINQLSKD